MAEGKDTTTTQQEISYNPRYCPLPTGARPIYHSYSQMMEDDSLGSVPSVAPAQPSLPLHIEPDAPSSDQARPYQSQPFNVYRSNAQRRPYQSPSSESNPVNVQTRLYQSPSLDKQSVNIQTSTPLRGYNGSQSGHRYGQRYDPIYNPMSRINRDKSRFRPLSTASARVLLPSSSTTGASSSETLGFIPRGQPSDFERKPSLYAIPPWTVSAGDVAYTTSKKAQPGGGQEPISSQQQPGSTDSSPVRQYYNPALVVEIANVAESSFPFDEVARRHGTSAQHVYRIWAAIVQVPLLRHVNSPLAGDLIKQYDDGVQAVLKSQQAQNGPRN